MRTSLTATLCGSSGSQWNKNSNEIDGLRIESQLANLRPVDCAQAQPGSLTRVYLKQMGAENHPSLLPSMRYEHIDPQWTLAQSCREEIELDQFDNPLVQVKNRSAVTCLVFFRLWWFYNVHAKVTLVAISRICRQQWSPTLRQLWRKFLKLRTDWKTWIWTRLRKSWSGKVMATNALHCTIFVMNFSVSTVNGVYRTAHWRSRSASDSWQARRVRRSMSAKWWCVAWQGSPIGSHRATW